MAAHTMYENALLSKGHGFPLWEPDPHEYAPVKLADVGYISQGGFVKLFNVSTTEDNWSNRLGFPNGHTPLLVGDIKCGAPLPKQPEYISSEGVSERGLIGIRQQGGSLRYRYCPHKYLRNAPRKTVLGSASKALNSKVPSWSWVTLPTGRMSSISAASRTEEP